VSDLIQRSSPPSDTHLLDIENLSIVYETASGPFTAVADFELTLNPGQKVAIVGESGSGKTNACMAIAGFLPSDAQLTADRLSCSGVDLRSRPRTVVPTRVDGVSVIFQDAMTSLDPVWTVGSQMRAVIRNQTRLGRRAANEQARDWLRRVGLDDVERIMAARPYELSGGMRQRVMIAIALSARPKLIIADEPTSALDATLSRELMQLLVSLTEDLDSALLLVSHDIQLCLEFADSLIVMKAGRVVERGTPDELATNAGHPYTIGLLSCVPTLETAGLSRLPTMSENSMARSA